MENEKNTDVKSEPKKVQFELHDPFSETTYVAESMEEMILKAEEMEALRFIAHTEDGQRVFVKKTGDQWNYDALVTEEPQAVIGTEINVETVEQKNFSGPENVIEMGISQTAEIEPDAVEFAEQMASRRRTLHWQRQVNLGVQKSEEEHVERFDQDEEEENRHAVDDMRTALPASVLRRFVRVEDKFYFPDETLAFLDKGDSLRARVEHKEVVTAIVSIAEARGWDKITVKGSEVFRRAVWLEASMRGIEARGYKPTAVEKAKLEMAFAKDAARATSGTIKHPEPVENVVEKGHDKNAQKSMDATSHAASEQIAGAPLRQHEGVLVAHGKDHYQHNPKERKSYWVKIQGDDGKITTIWGKDLERSFIDKDFKAGEKVNVAYMGNQPVTVSANEYDGAGNIIGHKQIETHRNEWNVTKAEAFRSQARSDVVKSHPDLAGAYGTIAAAQAFAKEKLPKEAQERFVAATKETVAQIIEEGRAVPAVKIKVAAEQEQGQLNNQSKNNSKDR